MQSLQCSGEVELLDSGNFKDWELILRVSFRLNSALAVLSGNRHSGGERAVSTIMFLLALQEMTSSPFRVVDEINQGMDERNERLVVDRLVQCCCDQPTSINVDRRQSTALKLVTTSKPQYFLVTPKLLPALTSLKREDVTVILVLNGPGIKSKWNFGNLVSQLRKRHRDDHNDENASRVYEHLSKVVSRDSENIDDRRRSGGSRVRM
jgi:structural maintenance of chromosomes protein 5